MIHQDKKRVCITMSNKKAKWLEDLANQEGKSISQMANLLISKNIYMIASLLTEEQWKDLQRVIKTKWLDDDAYPRW